MSNFFGNVTNNVRELPYRPPEQLAHDKKAAIIKSISSA